MTQVICPKAGECQFSFCRGFGHHKPHPIRLECNADGQPYCPACVPVPDKPLEEAQEMYNIPMK